jgi:hypothetical protein
MWSCVLKLNGILRSRRSKLITSALLLLALTDAVLGYTLIKNRAYLNSIAYSIAPPGTPERQIVKAVAEYVRDTLKRPTLADVEAMPLLVRWNYLYNPLRVGSVTILQYGQHHTGPCQSCSRVFKSLLLSHDIASRPVALHDADLNGSHGVSEVHYSDGSKGMVDPQNGIVFEHPDGRPASLQDLRDDRELFLSNVKKGWCYGRGPDEPDCKMAYPASLDGYDYKYAAYFNFRRFGPLKWPIHNFLTNMFGLDGPLLVPRPTWYANPTKTLLFSLNSIAALSALLIFLRSRRKCKKGPDDHQSKGPPIRREPVRGGEAIPSPTLLRHSGS